MTQKRLAQVMLLLLAMVLVGCSGGEDAAPGVAAAARAADLRVATHHSDDRG